MKMKNVEDIYPLSPMQQGMLFHTIYAGEEGVYTEQLSCTIEGPLNVPAFKRAVQQAVDRHPALRSYFLWDGLDEPLQVVRDRATLPWVEYDWRALPEDTRQARLLTFMEADQKSGFEITRAPLIRAALVGLTDDTLKFVFTYHHMLLDGWSAGLLFKEVFASYQADCAGRTIEHEPARPYSEYIAWSQRQDMARAESFWRRELKGFTAPTPLGVVRPEPHPPRRERVYEEEQAELSAAATEALQSFARSNRLTLSALLKGAWAVLLSRYSGEQDVVFGSTVSGRPPALDGAESIIGLFINTLPVRVKVSGEATVLDFLRGLQEQQFELQPFEHSPLTEVRRWSEVPGSLPLFQSILVFENHPLDNSILEQGGEGGRLRISGVESQGRIDYPLTLLAAPGERLALWVSYDTGLADRETINTLLGHLQTLLEGFTSNPRGRIDELEVATADEGRRILSQWGRPERALPAPYTLHGRFEERAAQAPDSIALSCEGRQITYSELDERADRLASRLRARGVGPETIVAVCLERSPEMVVALLAVLKAGGAYLPLDPAYPAERLSFMLEDSGARLVITERGLAGRMGEQAPTTLLIDDEGEEGFEALAGVAGAAPENLAYVIYTSGSTGRPKGVMVTHANVSRLFSASEQEFAFSSTDVWTLFHSYAFDFSVWELWGALLYGGRLEVVPYWVSRSPEAFYSLVEEAGVTMLSQTPSAFRQFMREDEARGGRLSLRAVIFGGEALEVGSLRGWVRRRGAERPRLINMYGITETTVHVTYRELGSEEVERGGASVIGWGLSDLSVYVAGGEGRRLCGAGVRGELCVGGAGLARGYLGRPSLTAERFVPDPFSGKPGARLYRSGDVGRYVAGGDIEYLGRADHQVKVRGFRIETGEIEAVIGEHADVAEAAVVIRQDGETEKRLVAYVVARPGARLSTGDLLAWARTKLPDYMIPSQFVALDALPLTANGKLDRRALPEPGGARPELEDAFVAPRTPVEEELAEIWRELLGVQQVGVHDNFFELGGHSLLLTQLASRISEAFQIKLPLRTLFDAPTVEEMTVAIAETMLEQADEQSVEEMLGELRNLSADEAAALLGSEA